MAAQVVKLNRSVALLAFPLLPSTYRATKLIDHEMKPGFLVAILRLPAPFPLALGWAEPFTASVMANSRWDALRTLSDSILVGWD